MEKSRVKIPLVIGGPPLSQLVSARLKLESFQIYKTHSVAIISMTVDVFFTSHGICYDFHACGHKIAVGPVHFETKLL